MKARRHRSKNHQRSPSHQPNRDEAGFTVAELLVGLALFSVLMTLLLGNVGFALKAWHQGSAHSERADHAMMVQAFLRRIIEEAYPLFIRDPSRPHVDFDGGRQSLSFLAMAPAVMEGGRFRFTLALERQHSRADLMLTARPELAGPQSGDVATRNVLLRDVEGLEISYFGKARQPQVEPWLEIWMQQPELPQLVRLRIGFRAGDTRRWPDLIVAPRTQADVGCAFDPLTRRCQGR